MELRHLRYFAAVAAQGSLSRAAERLHLSQPSLSRQIRQLERDIGTPLFERTTLTPAGTALHRHALLLLRLADATKDMARSATRQTREVADIGIAPGVPTNWLLQVLEALETEVPHAALTLTEAGSSEQLRMIREGYLDAGLVHEQPPGNLHAEHLHEATFGVAVRPGHPLTGQTTCRVGELDNLRILAPGRQQVPVVHDRLVIAAHDAGAVPLWQFGQFSEYALACAEATKADAVLLTEHSAHRVVPRWPWLPLTDPQLALVTWLAWPPETRTVISEVAQVILAAGQIAG
jgi:DNA-binding transcriptional LysR family regulator